MNRREFVTGILDELQQADVLSTIVHFLASKSVKSVRVEFGFVVQREVRGDNQREDAIVPLAELQHFIQQGLTEGTIEWSGTSDFRLFPLGLEMELMLCNDSDLHFCSTSPVLLLEFSRMISDRGVKVYESGKLVSV